MIIDTAENHGQAPAPMTAARRGGAERRARGVPRSFGARLAIDRILALGKKASRYTEADLARVVGISRERVRQLRARLPYKPVNTRLARVPGYGSRVEQAFCTTVRLSIDRLVALVDARGDDECWPWLGNTYRGYPVQGPGSQYVHRRIYEREHGPIPKGMLVVHTLGGRPCCNPRHLVLATGRERTWRTWRSGSRVDVSDELRGVTPAKVRAIRRAYAKLPRVKVRRLGGTFERVPSGCVKALAERFGMKDRRLLTNIAKGESCSWILPGNDQGSHRTG